MTATVGRIDEFDATKEEWTQYVERLEYFFVVNGIAGAEQKRAVLLMVMGATAYKLLQNLIAPAKPGEKDYKDLVGAMKQHHNPTPSEIVQRFMFNSRFRHPVPTVAL